MSDVSTGGDAGSEGIPAHVPGGTGELSTREAARSLTDWRNKLRAGVSAAATEQASQPKPEPPVSQPERAPEAPAADQSADEADATSPTPEPNGETSATDLEPKAPLIDPPPSWTQEQRQRWSKLDRETQEYLVEYDKKTSAEVSRAQKEAAEQLKGLSAREQAMEQQRLQMEAVTIEKAKALQKVLQRDFSDIQSIDDVKKMADEDWGRYNKWQVLQQELAMENAQAQEAQRRQAEAAQTAFSKFAQEQDKKFVERVPDFADKEKASKLQSAAIEMLTDIGFSPEELARHWNGQEFISLRDARLQETFNDAAKYREAQKAAKKAVANKTLQPVLRPGVAQQSNSYQQEIRALEKRIDNETGHKQLRLLSDLKALKQKAGEAR